jgi:hypothetical protein
VVQGLDTVWKWSVPALVGQTKSGKAENHAAGVKAAQQAIDKALAPKKQHLRRPESRRPPTEAAYSLEAFTGVLVSPI